MFHKMLHFRKKFIYFLSLLSQIHRSLTLHFTVFFKTTPPPPPVYLHPPAPRFTSPSPQFIPPSLHPSPQFTPPLCLGRGEGKKLEGARGRSWDMAFSKSCKLLKKFAKFWKNKKIIEFSSKNEMDYNGFSFQNSQL